MSKQLHRAFNEILEMPYFENERARSGKTINGHEDAIAVRFTDHGFEHLANDEYPTLGKTLVHAWAKTNHDPDFLREEFGSMPLGSFIEQPAGTQSFPDFLLRDFNDSFLAIEAKSGRDGRCPMWNDNMPKHGAIYILSSGKLDETTVFLGEDVISHAVYDIKAQQEEEINSIVRKYNKLMESADSHNRGWVAKSRRQHFQAGGMDRTNYFTHKDRSKCEQNVLDRVKI